MDTDKIDFIANGLFSAPEELAQRNCKTDNCTQKYRTMFMRDRDRVLYSKSFRRLAGKTQIYLSGSDDHQRNRLTHTLEVAQIASTMTHALGLNRDLTEAIALGHDLGHTPFGHAGEQILHSIMVPNDKHYINASPMGISDERYPGSYGFKHNMQSVRMAVILENIYGDAGLNLTNYTLWGLQKHSNNEYPRSKLNTSILKPDVYDQYESFYSIKDHPQSIAWSFEAFVVAEADEIAQLHHDLEDAIRGKAMTRDDVYKTVKSNLSGIMCDEDKTQLAKMHCKDIDDETYIILLSKVVVNTLVNQIIKRSLENFAYLQKKYAITTDTKINFFLTCDPRQDEIRKAISYDTFGNSTDIFKRLRKYSNVISVNVHNSNTVQRMNIKGQYIIKKIFQAYYSNPQQLPNHSIAQFLISAGQYKSKETAMKIFASKGEGAVRTKFDKFYKSSQFNNNKMELKLMRVICDHIASMTDNYAIEEFEKLYN